MQRTKAGTITAKYLLTIAVLGVAWPGLAQEVKTPYPHMAPLGQYLMPDRASEIALARSAAPESIARDAEVLVLGRHGYETAVPGRNGFVCLVERSWVKPVNDPDFWDPKMRAPLCLNSPAAHSYLPRTLKKTALILAGQTKTQMMEAVTAAIASKELPPIEPGAMSYMLSKQGYLSSRDGHWHPHLMFFYSQIDPAAWGAGLPGSPVLAFNDTSEHLTTFLVPVRRWSDGTPDQ